MTNKTDSFLSNACMQAIIQLKIKFPNDTEFGNAVRSFIQDTKQPVNKTPLDQPDMGDVDEN